MVLVLQARSFNVDPDLVRISVGLEEVSDLRGRFQRALDAVEKVKKIDTVTLSATPTSSTKLNLLNLQRYL